MLVLSSLQFFGGKETLISGKKSAHKSVCRCSSQEATVLLWTTKGQSPQKCRMFWPLPPNCPPSTQLCQRQPIWASTAVLARCT